jgi:N-acetylneuraminic acid mutarotase
MRHFARFASVFMLVGGAAAAAAQQPVTITSTGDFERGNNEGLVSPALDRVTRERVTAGTVQPWAATNSLPLGTGAHATVVYGAYIYVVGGSPDGYSVIDNVRYAPLNADGSVGGWSSTTSLPFARGAHSAVAFNGYMYAIGGSTDFTATVDEVLVAPINEDGSLGAWTATTALPDGRFYHSSLAFNGFVYVVGGTYDGGLGWYDDVLYAPLNGDGSVGDWSSTSDLPDDRFFYSTTRHGSYIYLTGGQDSGFNSLSDVVVAPINPDGTLGAFTATTPFGSGRHFHASAAHNGFIYLVAGYNSDVGPIASVLSAPVEADGELGTWTAVASLPAGVIFPTAAAHHDFIHVIGGFDETFTVMADVQYASIDPDDADANQAPGLLRGACSFLVDLENDSPTRFITINGNLSSGGVIRLQIRVAPGATGIFGAETVVDPVTLGAPFEVAGSGRYVWLRFSLDDTGAGDVNDPTYVSDFTVSATGPPTPGVVHDGSAADIDTQTSNSTIAANWNGFVAAAGDTIASYEWSIGTAPGLTNVQGWVNVGLTTSASNSSLSLSNGVKYVNVRAISGLGLVSSPATSDGVQVQSAAGADPGGGGSDHKGRCNQSASASPGSAAGLLAGVLLLARALRRR